MTSTNRNIGFVSTRFQGNDGVSLESEKWLGVLTRLGYACYLFSGDCDEHEREYTYLVPEAHFKHPDVQAIHKFSFTLAARPPEVTRQIHILKDHLKQHLYKFVALYNIHLLIVENALAIPLNLPLGLALTEVIAETGLHTIAHHHDFFWERKRFLINCVWDYLNMAFPPHLPWIRHVVINSSASNQLSLRTGISAMMIPNVMDFDHPPPVADEYIRSLRQDLGIAPDEYFFLQPTRVVQRKGIEHAIELIHRLGLKARLVISHASGDEGHEYEQHLHTFAELLDAPTNFISDIIREARSITSDGRKVYTLWDAYHSADLVTYPSTMEGFGNAFLEAIYFRKPIVVNNYSIFAIDIKPKGFQVIEFDGFITDQTVRQVRNVIENPATACGMVDHNYQLAKKHYSYTMLERRLQTLLMECFGEEVE
jgi:glycosyltransferase involved in cell wall biosynthesis